jgi:hypothetical protein
LKGLGDGRMEKRAAKLAKRMEDYKQAGQKPGYWRRRKKVSEREWRALVHSGREDVFRFMPNKFVYTPFFMYSKLDNNSKQLKSWVKDYFEYLLQTQDADYGEQLCGKCILRPKYVHIAYDNVDSLEIKDVAAKEFIRQVKLPLAEEKIMYPCPVANRFNCPFKDAEKWNDKMLIVTGAIIDYLCEAIHYAGYLYENTFYLHFDKDQITAYNYFTGKEEILAPIQKGIEKLIEFERSNILLKTAEDVFCVLHDKAMLQRLIEQYPDPKRSKHMTESMIEFYWDMRDVFSIDKLKGPGSGTIEDSIRSDTESSGARPQYAHRYFCHVCNDKLVNIECVTCRKRVCTEHWRDHRKQFHSQFPANDTTP